MGSCASLKPRGTVRGGCPGCSNEPVEGEPITPADHSKAGLAACPVPNHGEDIIALTAASGTVLGRLNPDRPVSPPIKTEYLLIGFPLNYIHFLVIAADNNASLFYLFKPKKVLCSLLINSLEHSLSHLLNS